MALLEASGIGKNFGDTKVLKDISLTLEQGEALAIIGSSGSGKTTLLRCLNFLETADAGQLVFDGESFDLAHAGRADIARLRKKTAFVFQNYNLFRNKTALQNVTEGLIVARKLPKEQADEIGMKMLAKVGLADRADYYPRQLSGGQQQRVAIARALAAAKAKGRNTVHVKVWLPLPAACPAQSNITLDSFTAQPTYIAPETAPQRTAYWEADLAENCRFGAQYSYRSTAHYAAPLEMQADPVQPDFDTAEQLPHIAFTPYMKALAAQLTEGITDPVQKAKRIYDFVTLNVHYHFQPMYFVHENITDNCARSRRGDCGVMAATFITLCRIAGIPAKWQSGMVARPETAGCHDWAMFYIAPKGWMYADCSAGASMARAGNEKMRLHYFGNLDTDRMVANSDICAPFDPPMCSFRADPCDNQVGEMEVDGVGLYGQQVETTQEIVKHQEV